MGQKRRRGFPIVWDELKKTRGFTLTETANEGLKSLAKQHECNSVSDFLEHIARGMIPVGKDESIAETIEDLVILFKGLEARLSNLERLQPEFRQSQHGNTELKAEPLPSELPQTSTTFLSSTLANLIHRKPAKGRPICPQCDSINSRSMGLRQTAAGKYRRLRCQRCGLNFRELVE